MAIALFSVLRSSLRTLFPRRVGNSLPTMHSLSAARGQRGCQPGGVLSQQRPLRVVRSSGRIVITGRMADVCAELERLAALEAVAG